MRNRNRKAKFEDKQNLQIVSEVSEKGLIMSSFETLFALIFVLN